MELTTPGFFSAPLCHRLGAEFLPRNHRNADLYANSLLDSSLATEIEAETFEFHEKLIEALL